MKKIIGTICVSLVLVSSVAHAEIFATRVPQATAECGDGMYSDSVGRGTCSQHGGVRRWLNRSETNVAATSNSAAPESGSVLSSENTTYETAQTETLPNTGGEPLLMVALGSLVSGSAFFLRRKIK